MYATEWFATRTGPEDSTGTKSDTNWAGILYKVTDLIIPLRVDEDQEAEGLDISQHGETALGIDLLAGAHRNGKPKVEELVSSGV